MIGTDAPAISSAGSPARRAGLASSGSLERGQAGRFADCRRTLGQLLRFAVTGGLNTLIDLLTLNLLLWLLAVRATLPLLACNVLAYSAGAVNSLLLNKYWTFRRRERLTWGELLRFALVTLCGSLWSTLFLWLAGQALRIFAPDALKQTLWINAAKVVAIGGTALISYLGLRLWVFVRGRPAAQQPPARISDTASPRAPHHNRDCMHRARKDCLRDDR